MHMRLPEIYLGSLLLIKIGLYQECAERVMELHMVLRGCMMGGGSYGRNFTVI